MLFIHLFLSVAYLTSSFVIIFCLTLFTCAKVLHSFWKESKYDLFICVLILQIILGFGNVSLRSKQPSPPPFPSVKSIESTIDKLSRISNLPEGFNETGDCSAVFNDLRGRDNHSYVSISFLDLYYRPLCWDGSYFTNNYVDLDPERLTLKFVDGRLFLVYLKPVPDLEKVEAYVGLEILLSSTHQTEKGKSWLVSENKGFMNWNLDLATLSNSLEFDALLELLGVETDIQISMIPDAPGNSDYDWGLMIWVLVVLYVLGKDAHKQNKHLLTFLILQSLYLAFMEPSYDSDLRVFSFETLGTSSVGYLMSSPFNLALFSFFVLIYSEIQFSLLGKELYRRLSSGFLLIVSGFLVVMLLNGDFTSVSFNHPIKCVQEPERFLALLSLFALLSASFRCLEFFGKSLRTSPLLLFVVVGIATAILLAKNAFGMFVAFGFAFIVRRFRNSVFFKSALIILSLYPMLVMKLHVEELEGLKGDLLDELTLLDERNYFLTIEVAKSLPRFVKSANQVSEEHLAYLFAKQSGLLDRNIDYLVTISSHDGRLVSELNNHVNYDTLSLLSLPNLRITSFEDPFNGLKFMAYRESFEMGEQLYDLTFVLNNDYRNFSLSKQLRLFLNKDRSKPFAYTFEVFGESGALIHSPISSFVKGLDVSELDALSEKPVMLKQDGRDTILLIKIKGEVYRITHVATPLKMIFSRFIILWTFLLVFQNFLSGVFGKRRTFFGAWRKSFSFKLSVFLFSSSALLVLLFCYFWVIELRKNQEREQELFIESTVLATQDIFSRLSYDDKFSLMEPGAFYDVSLSLGTDMSLYYDGIMRLTTQPELFFKGLLKNRIRDDSYRRLYRGQEYFIFEKEQGKHAPSIVYVPIDIGENDLAVVGLTIVPFGQKQAKRFKEQLEVSLALFLGILFCIAIASRSISKNFLKPVSAITRSAFRMTNGFSVSPINITRHDELQKMVMAFNYMLEAIHNSQDKLKKQIKIQELTLDAMSNGLLGFNRSGLVVLQNEKAWSLLGLEPLSDIEALVSTLEDVSPLQSFFDENVDDAFSMSRISGGESLNLLLKARQIPSTKENDVSFLVIIEDVTDLMAKNRFKSWSEMASRVAHEIKNPLTPIQLEMEFLQKFYKDGRPGFEGALDDATEEVLNQVKHLKKIAAEFSEYSRPMTLELEETNLIALCEDILLPYRKSLLEMKIETSYEFEGLMMLDGRILRRAIHNLIINSIQAMDEVGCLGIRLWRDDDHILLGISDTGPGIPVGERHQIFDAYFSTKEHGSGLGLVITKRIIQAHKGQIGIDDNYTDGTRFLIRFPESLLV